MTYNKRCIFKREGPCLLIYIYIWLPKGLLWCFLFWWTLEGLKMMSTGVNLVIIIHVSFVNTYCCHLMTRRIQRVYNKELKDTLHFILQCVNMICAEWCEWWALEKGNIRAGPEGVPLCYTLLGFLSCRLLATDSAKFFSHDSGFWLHFAMLLSTTFSSRIVYTQLTTQMTPMRLICNDRTTSTQRNRCV